uniref:Uncharacterized protein n=1 Tax=Timema tahoe TaxID=61484 RepID=A0A7R9I9R2_9NEOP|nr:unnamed protein product [Timema tahoe]
MHSLCAAMESDWAHEAPPIFNAATLPPPPITHHPYHQVVLQPPPHSQQVALVHSSWWPVVEPPAAPQLPWAAWGPPPPPPLEDEEVLQQLVRQNSLSSGSGLPVAGFSLADDDHLLCVIPRGGTACFIRYTLCECTGWASISSQSRLLTFRFIWLNIDNTRSSNNTDPLSSYTFRN